MKPEARARQLARVKARYWANPDKFRKYRREYYAAHKKDERRVMNAYRIAHKKEANQRNKIYRDTHKETLKEKWLMRNYSLSQSEFIDLLNGQKGLCAICLNPVLGHDRCVDHSHATGRVRGILCRNCNFALGYVREDPKIARSMANYLKKHKKGGEK